MLRRLRESSQRKRMERMRVEFERAAAESEPARLSNQEAGDATDGIPVDVGDVTEGARLGAIIGLGGPGGTGP
jgi:hypothetical protein